MHQYLELCQYILNYGEQASSRTGIDTINIFGAMMKFDLREGFPILTTKKVLFDTVVDELLWFIRGGHNIHDSDAPKKIWDAWADGHGDLGRIYGVQWREWGKDYTFSLKRKGLPYVCVNHNGVDQLQLAINRIKHSPNSRRNIISAWNALEIEEDMMNFPPCHVMFQFRVMEHGTRLDLAMYQRSCDMALGVPFNISSYALLLTLVANECNLVPGIFTHFLADAHIYVNHIAGIEKQLKRIPRSLPLLLLVDDKAWFSEGEATQLPLGYGVTSIKKSNILLYGYEPHPFIKFDVAV